MAMVSTHCNGKYNDYVSYVICAGIMPAHL